MRRRLLSYLLAPLVLACGLCLPAAQAQVGPAQADASSEEETPQTSAFPYMVAAVFTLLILVIVCMPSRKA